MSTTCRFGKVSRRMLGRLLHDKRKEGWIVEVDELRHRIIFAEMKKRKHNIISYHHVYIQNKQTPNKTKPLKTQPPPQPHPHPQHSQPPTPPTHLPNPTHLTLPRLSRSASSYSPPTGRLHHAPPPSSTSISDAVPRDDTDTATSPPKPLKVVGRRYDLPPPPSDAKR